MRAIDAGPGKMPSSLDAHIRLWDLEVGKQMRAIDAGPGKMPSSLDAHIRL